MEGPTKRKRGQEYPRVTYHAADRTFDRLFKEESLDDLKSVVRRKLGLKPDALITLAQLRQGKAIDLDDNDDFDAFRSVAEANSSVEVRVSIGNAVPDSTEPPDPDPRPSVGGSTSVPGTSSTPISNQHVNDAVLPTRVSPAPLSTDVIEKQPSKKKRKGNRKNSERQDLVASDVAIQRDASDNLTPAVDPSHSSSKVPPQAPDIQPVEQATTIVQGPSIQATAAGDSAPRKTKRTAKRNATLPPVIPAESSSKTVTTEPHPTSLASGSSSKDPHRPYLPFAEQLAGAITETGANNMQQDMANGNDVVSKDVPSVSTNKSGRAQPRRSTTKAPPATEKRKQGGQGKNVRRRSSTPFELAEATTAIKAAAAKILAAKKALLNTTKTDSVSAGPSDNGGEPQVSASLPIADRTSKRKRESTNARTLTRQKVQTIQKATKGTAESHSETPPLARVNKPSTRMRKSSTRESRSSSSGESDGDVAISKSVASQIPLPLPATSASLAGFDLESIVRGPVGAHISIPDIPSSESEDDGKMSLEEEVEDHRSGGRKPTKRSRYDSSDDDDEVGGGDEDDGNGDTLEDPGVIGIPPQLLVSSIHDDTRAPSPQYPNFQLESVNIAHLRGSSEVPNGPAGSVEGAGSNGRISAVIETTKSSDPLTGTAPPVSQTTEVDVPLVNQEPSGETTTFGAEPVPEGEPTSTPMTSTPLERQLSASPRGMAGRLRSRSQLNPRQPVRSTPPQTKNGRTTKNGSGSTKSSSRSFVSIPRSTPRQGKRSVNEKGSLETPYYKRRSVLNLHEPTPSSATDEPPSAWTFLKETPSNSPMMVDELHSSPMTTPQNQNLSTDGAQPYRDNPLFILTQSQVPFPYTRQEPLDKIPSAEGSEDEVEAATSIQPTPGRAPPYRRLTEIASEHSKFMTPSLRPARFPSSTRDVLDYGTAVVHEVEAIDTDDTDESDTPRSSHIPEGRRAGDIS